MQAHVRVHVRGANASTALSGPDDAGLFYAATSDATSLECRGLFLRRQAAITLHARDGPFCALNPTGPLCVGVAREKGARDAEPHSPCRSSLSGPVKPCQRLKSCQRSQ